MFKIKDTLPFDEENLRCKYKEWNGMEVAAIDLSDLWTFFPLTENTKNEKYGEVGEEFFAPLKADIKENGMNNPVVVLPITKEFTSRWEGNFAMWLCRNPIDWNEEEVQLAVFTGNNRYHVAKQLGYTSIDCVILETDALVSASRLQDPVNSTKEK